MPTKLGGLWRVRISGGVLTTATVCCLSVRRRRGTWVGDDRREGEKAGPCREAGGAVDGVVCHHRYAACRSSTGIAGPYRGRDGLGRQPARRACSPPDPASRDSRSQGSGSGWRPRRRGVRRRPPSASGRPVSSSDRPHCVAATVSELKLPRSSPPARWLAALISRAGSDPVSSFIPDMMGSCRRLSNLSIVRRSTASSFGRWISTMPSSRVASTAFLSMPVGIGIERSKARSIYSTKLCSRVRGALLSVANVLSSVAMEVLLLCSVFHFSHSPENTGQPVGEILENSF